MFDNIGGGVICQHMRNKKERNVTELISFGNRRARKPHQCFHCYRTIAKGEYYKYSTCVYDSIYTLKMHIDCDEFAAKYMKDTNYSDFYDEGYPPVADLFSDALSSSEREDVCNSYRGHYPHVITRLEHNHQDQEMRYLAYRAKLK